MSGTTRLNLDAIISPAAARVVVEVDAQGRTTQASFDLTGLPRVDELLVGRPVLEVPTMVERLCGICPAAHHLAGVAALEQLLGFTEIPVTAAHVRRLLHLGSTLDNHAVRLFGGQRDAALALRRYAKLAMKAAGSPGHFPTTACPGGVVSGADEAACQELVDLGGAALSSAMQLADAQFAGSDLHDDAFAGADLALVDDHGRPDLSGSRLRACVGGEPVMNDAPAARWPQVVAETRLGDAAPRPHLVGLGAGRGNYRVGPVSQLRVGELATPRAAELQRRWLDEDRSALSARAVLLVHAVEAIVALLDSGGLTSGPTCAAGPQEPASGDGVGYVDGPRGLLVHHYRAGADQRLAWAQILTPTAQNEQWLSGLLTSAATGLPGAGGAQGSPERVRDLMEQSIREADPCLPCTSAPPGGMDLQVDLVRTVGDGEG